MAFIFLVNVLRLLVGTMMEMVPSIIIFPSVLLPLVKRLNIPRPVLAPPCSRPPPSRESAWIESAVLFFYLVAILLLISFFPFLVIFLPRLLYGR